MAMKGREEYSHLSLVWNPVRIKENKCGHHSITATTKPITGPIIYDLVSSSRQPKSIEVTTPGFQLRKQRLGEVWELAYTQLLYNTPFSIQVCLSPKSIYTLKTYYVSDTVVGSGMQRDEKPSPGGPQAGREYKQLLCSRQHTCSLLIRCLGLCETSPSHYVSWSSHMPTDTAIAFHFHVFPAVRSEAYRHEVNSPKSQG